MWLMKKFYCIEMLNKPRDNTSYDSSYWNFITVLIDFMSFNYFRVECLLTLNLYFHIIHSWAYPLFIFHSVIIL